MASKIKVDQIEGSTGSSITIPTGQTLTITDGIAASTIGSGTLSSDRLPTVPVAKGGTGLTSLGTANQVVAVNSGATALEFQTVSSDIVKLAQNNSPTATNSFDGYFDGTKYKTYKIIIDSVHPNSGNTGNRIGFKFRRSNSDLSSNYTFNLHRFMINSAGNSADQGQEYNWQNGDRIKLSQDISNGAAYTLSAVIYLFGVHETTRYPTMIADITSHNSGGSPSDFYRSVCAGVNNSTGALSGFTVYTNVGDLDDGHITLYGIK